MKNNDKKDKKDKKNKKSKFNDYTSFLNPEIVASDPQGMYTGVPAAERTGKTAEREKVS